MYQRHLVKWFAATRRHSLLYNQRRLVQRDDPLPRRFVLVLCDERRRFVLVLREDPRRFGLDLRDERRFFDPDLPL
jgi:hypothetical protein